MVYKIKWGDLEDDVLIPHHDLENDNLVIRKKSEVESNPPEVRIQKPESLKEVNEPSPKATPMAEEEAEVCESKERFRQRLWCFLFENLNRAVDELYLLCELECDLEQLNEAILVLGEAASDFKELNGRVEEFENVKKSSSVSNDGSGTASMAIKSMDRRRPHALSWEVRRMTTSPHRAEILSSSLEAFKKIQQERATMCAAIAAKTPGPSPHNTHEIADDIPKPVGRRDKIPTAVLSGKSKRELVGPTSEMEKPNKEREKRTSSTWKSMDAWKEKRNWEDVLASPYRGSSRISHSPGMNRRSADRSCILHDKLMSPEKKKKTALDLKKDAEQKHARAMRIRTELENERVQKLQRTSEKLNRVNEMQAVRSMKLREGMHARLQRSESRHEAFLAQVVRRAGDESSKVNEVRFITSLNEENKKLMIRQKLHDSELRRAEKLQVMKSKQKEDMAREEAVLERKKLIETEKLQRLAETQRKKDEAQVRREEERKASSAAREAKAIEQLRKKEVRAKAQQEEAELLAQKLAERLNESEQRRKFYLEQIRERASMDFRDQSSPLLRRGLNKEGQGGYQTNDMSGLGSTLGTGSVVLQHSLKRRIKRIRQRLMALKYDFLEASFGVENGGIGYRTAVGTARAKIGRWLQELQRHRQARKEGAASIGLITAEMIKFLEGKDPELQAARQAGLLDFIASALPASHTSKPEACQVTIYLLRLLKVVLSTPANRSYFLAQNLLPPVIPMLSTALENYIKIAASLNVPGPTTSLSTKTSVENFESISEVLDGFLWTVATILGNTSSDERQLQMQDGLLELVVAYQVIHRLRDLFALYDRPQIEWSPFPSSIILSINLLTVLTSRPRAISMIDWECISVQSDLGNGSQEAKLVDSADCRLLLSVLNSSTVVRLPDLPEDGPLDESSKTKRTEISIEDGSKSLDLQMDDKNSENIGAEQKNENILVPKQPVAFLLSAISETGLVSLPSLLTAVLLQANNRLSSEQASYVLPSNFEEVATGVLKVLNNLALVDITLMQRMLGRPDLKMEFFHLTSFLLSHCTSKWKVASDQVGLLLLESLLLLGYFALFHPENQAVLRWGQSPTILHKVCDLPFVFFSDPELMPILAATLVAACFVCDQNKGIVQQELSTDMLLSLLKSCRASLPTIRSTIALDNPPTDDSTELNQPSPEFKKLQTDPSPRSIRSNTRTTRVLKNSIQGNITRIMKIRNQKAAKIGEDSTLKQPNLSSSETPTTIMLHSRFPSSFIHRAEQFFSVDVNSVA